MTDLSFINDSDDDDEPLRAQQPTSTLASHHPREEPPPETIVEQVRERMCKRRRIEHTTAKVTDEPTQMLVAGSRPHLPASAGDVDESSYEMYMIKVR